MLKSHNTALKSKVFEQADEEWSLVHCSDAISHSVTRKHEVAHQRHRHKPQQAVGRKGNYLLFFLKSLMKDLIFALMKTTISRTPAER